MSARAVCRLALASLIVALGTAQGVRAQDLATQLTSTVTAQQRAFLDFFADGDGVRLTGGLNGAAAPAAVLPDGDLAYAVGQQVLWQLTSPAGGQLYLFDIGASGGARQLVPNAFTGPRPLAPGQGRLVPSAADGMRLFMSAESRIQLWLALVVPGGEGLNVPLVGDPRLGEVSGGAAGLLSYISAQALADVPMGFALTVFGQTIPPLPPEDVERTLGLGLEQAAGVQTRLNTLGFDVGEADGLFGRNTREGLRAWQASLGLDQTGYLNAYTLRRLLEI